MSRPASALALLFSTVLAACGAPTMPDRGIQEGGAANFSSHYDCYESDEYGNCESLPPPPPLDTTGTYQESQSSSQYIAMTYFFSKTANTGWISFGKQQPAGVAASPQARIDYKKGEVSGRGTLTLAMSDGQVRILHLARDVVRAQFSGDCTKQCMVLSFQGGGTFTMARPRIVESDQPR